MTNALQVAKCTVCLVIIAIVLASSVCGFINKKSWCVANGKKIQGFGMYIFNIPYLTGV